MIRIKGYLAKYGTIILSIILFITQILLISLSGVSLILTKTNIKNIVNQVDIVKMAKANVKIEIENNEVKTQNTINEDGSYLTPLYNKAATYGISQTTVDAIINSAAFKDFLGDYAGNNIEYFFFDSGKPISNPTAEIINTVEGSIDAINKQEKLNLTPTQKAGVVNALKDNAPAIGKRFPNSSKLNQIIETNGYEDAIGITKYALGGQLKYILAAIFLISCIGIITINLYYHKWTIWIGVTSIIAGAQVLFYGLVLKLYVCCGISNYPNVEMALKPIISAVGTRFLLGGAIILLFGTSVLYFGKQARKNNEDTIEKEPISI